MKISKFRNAYELSISAKANTLEFETDHHTTYEIYTAPGLKIIPGFVFSSHLIYLGFCPKGNYSRDAKVIPTIMNFILDLFEDKNAIVAYIHSSEGDLHKVRERYFNSLYNLHNDGTLLKTLFHLGADDRAVILYRTDNTHVKAIQNLSAEEVISRMEHKEQYADYHF